MKDFEKETLPTYVKEDLTVLFCGINPGRISAIKGYHYANPVNVFWRGLHEGGLTPYQLKPEETMLLLHYGYGITDLVARASRSSSNLRKKDYDEGRIHFQKLVAFYKPKVVCFNGITAFREAVRARTVSLGLQTNMYFGDDKWEGCYVFVVPSTSGANASYTREEKVDSFKELATFLRKKGWLH